MYASLTNFLLGRASRTLALSCLSYQPCLLRLKTKDVKAQSSKAEIKLNLKPYFARNEALVCVVVVSQGGEIPSKVNLRNLAEIAPALSSPALCCAVVCVCRACQDQPTD